jgi:hypothetical protein
VLGQPRDAQLSCELVKGVLGKAEALAQGRKGSLSLLLAYPGDGTGFLPGGIGSHAAQALLSFRKDGVVALPTHFQMPMQACGLPCVHNQRQFQQKRGGFLAARFLLVGMLCAHGPHLVLEVERPFQ